MRGTLTAVLALAILFAGAAFAQSGGRGIGSGRATGSDVAGLLRDIRLVLDAERAFNSDLNDRRGQIANDTVDTALSRGRQAEMLGIDIDPELSPAALALTVRAWWIEHVLQPALDIAANPAASCGLARQMVQRILVLERQAQVLGLETARFGDLGDGDSIIGRAYKLLQQRCLEEAFDECMDTGNGRALIDFAGAFRMIGADAGTLEQAAYLFRRCTVYSLVYHLEFDSAVRDIRQSVVADGSYVLLFYGEGGDVVTLLATGVWSGPRPQEMASPNVLLTALDCGVAAVSCDLEESPFGGLARGRLTMTRRDRPQTIRVVTETVAERMLGGRIVVENDPCGTGSDGQALVQPPEGCTEGEDLAAFSFAPPDFITLARLRPGFGPLTRAGPSSDIYYLATGSTGDDPMTIGQWMREGYPLLYTAAIDRTERLPGTRGGLFQAHVRGTFELRHRPDLFPPEEIDASLELSATRPEPPPRIPLS